MNFIQKGNQLVCACENDIFISMGDMFGFTMVECSICGKQSAIVETTMTAKKLLSPYGEDYCRVFGHIIGGEAIVDYLVFAEFETTIIMLSCKDRIERIKAEKQRAIENEWFKRAAKLRDEEKLIEWNKQQINNTAKTIHTNYS